MKLNIKKQNIVGEEVYSINDSKLDMMLWATEYIYKNNNLILYQNNVLIATFFNVEVNIVI